jgi:hypothetical protein
LVIFTSDVADADGGMTFDGVSWTGSSFCWSFCFINY